MSVKPTGFRELQRELVQVAERGGDAGPAFEKVAVLFREDQRANFERGGRPRWKPLSPQYAAWKAQHRPGAAIGVLTGTMRDSFIHADATHNLTVIKKDQMRIGSTDPVGNLFGGRHTVHKQPKRKPYTLTPARRREYLALVQDYLTKGEL